MTHSYDSNLLLASQILVENREFQTVKMGSGHLVRTASFNRTAFRTTLRYVLVFPSCSFSV